MMKVRNQPRRVNVAFMIGFFKDFISLNVSDLNFVNYVAIKTCMGNTLFDQICLYIYIQDLYSSKKTFVKIFNNL